MTRELDLTPLVEFGQEAGRLELPGIEEGGFVVPRRELTRHLNPGKEESTHEQRQGARQEAGPAAGPRQRPQAEAAAPGQAAHALGTLACWRTTKALGELQEYHPDVRVTYDSPRFLGLSLPVGLFRELPFRARLELEVPLVARDELTRPYLPYSYPYPRRTPRSMVPDVRAWAVWVGGVEHSAVVRSHHQYPDLGMCAHMPGEWVLGVHSLRDLVAFCILWIAKSLHERELGSYPGLQHSSILVRTQRDRREEFCGCGKPERYDACCRTTDFETPPYARWLDSYVASHAYLDELRWQGRAISPPLRLLRSDERRQLRIPLGADR